MKTGPLILNPTLSPHIFADYAPDDVMGVGTEGKKGRYLLLTFFMKEMNWKKSKASRYLFFETKL